MYRDRQPTDYIALEFMVSPEILGMVQRGSVLWRALQEGEAGIPEQGFAWLATENKLARIVELTRSEIERKGDADAVLTALLTEQTPGYLARLKG